MAPTCFFFWLEENLKAASAAAASTLSWRQGKCSRFLNSFSSANNEMSANSEPFASSSAPHSSEMQQPKHVIDSPIVGPRDYLVGPLKGSLTRQKQIPPSKTTVFVSTDPRACHAWVSLHDNISFSFHHSPKLWHHTAYVFLTLANVFSAIMMLLGCLILVILAALQLPL